jgi:two-component system chemotaxis response regulator CheY
MPEEKIVRVLIVDDYELTRSLMRAMLDGDRFDIVGEAEDGKEGLEMGLILQPDMILLDNNMPGVFGMTVLPELRAKLPLAEILMMTADDDMALVKQAMALGANGYIVKPFNMSSVMEILNQSRNKIMSAGAADIH